MSERIDILMPPINSLPHFTVDTTGPLYVPLIYAFPLPLNYLMTAAGKHIFTRGDNFIIMSGGVTMPLSFQIDRSSTTWPYLQFIVTAKGLSSGKTYTLKEISGAPLSPQNFMMMENYDTSLDIFIDLQNQDPVTGSYLKNENFTIGVQIYLSTPTVNISMVGVPAALNMTAQYVLPYVKLLHSIAVT